MKPIRTAVIGVGYLGKYHAEKYAILPQSQLIAICDQNQDRAFEIAQQFGVQAVQDYTQLIGQVDAVSIAVPTILHYSVAKFFLEHNVHVLLEKPITVSLKEADELIAIAKSHQVLLQVGHLERFNNVLQATQKSIENPRFIESLRLAPFKPRGTDVNVVLDLMIHDIDIIQSIEESNITHIAATGACVLTPDIDIANARIEFASGCVANVTASRISLSVKRQMRIFQHNMYMMLDLQLKKLAIHRKGTKEMFPGIPEITREVTTFSEGDALKDEIASFLQHILDKKEPVVSGEEARRALATALEITHIVNAGNKRFSF